MNLSSLMDCLGFVSVAGKSGSWIKSYADNQIITVTTDGQGTIDRGNIAVAVATTSNLSQPETLVVLECVDRLLMLGYDASCITLERPFKVGRGNSGGRLDISVTHPQTQTTWMMIECKTRGSEYTKEVEKMKTNGGQLLSYFLQDKNTQFLVLYASRIQGSDVEHNNMIINAEFLDGNNVSELHHDRTIKGKELLTTGILEPGRKPYVLDFKNLMYKDLAELTQESGKSIFYSFAKILRRHAVSDKTNAFNKIFNLFLCKIKDEQNYRHETDEVGFAWRKEDSFESFLTRLNDLYIAGVKDFLGIQTDTRFQAVTSNFGFMEVYDQTTYDQNASIVRDIVLLLQGFKIRYTYKHQFLGDFFEMLLNTGIKQEAGQFFTPTPLAQFITKSLPIAQIIQTKIANGTNEILPYIIDYACGSGHFLTEAMDEIGTTAQLIDQSSLTMSQRRHYEQYIKDLDYAQFRRAREYVYGIEKDYRLAKTAQVSFFLNGDGEALIHTGSGISPLGKYPERFYKLNQIKQNGAFDIVVANPPYSVQNFKASEPKLDESFTLAPSMGDNSDDIECIFIERTIQLLSIGGVAGIILPTSILSNGGIHGRTRTFLLANCEIKGIVELGDKAFMATGVKTVIVFFQKIPAIDIDRQTQEITDYLRQAIDFAYNNKPQIVSAFVAQIGMSLDELRSGLDDRTIDEGLIATKILRFAYLSSQPVVLVKSGEKAVQEKFYGYTFSERSGQEGINIFHRGGMMFDATSTREITTLEQLEQINHRADKVNSYILRNFAKKLSLTDVVDSSLVPFVQIASMHETIDWNARAENWDLRIQTNVEKKIQTIQSSYPLEILGNLVENLDGQRKPVKKLDRSSGSIPYYGATGIIDLIDEYIFDGQYLLLGEDGAKRGKNDKKSFIVEGKFWANNHVHVMKPKSVVLIKYLEIIVNIMDLSDYITGINVPKLNQKNMNQIQIPLPPLTIQQTIVDEIEKLEQHTDEKKKTIKEKKEEIENIIGSIIIKKQELRDVATIVCGQSPKGVNYNDTKTGLPFYQGKVDFGENYLKNPRVRTTQITKESVQGDILLSVRAPVGPVNINSFERICIGRGLAALQANSNVVIQTYLFYYLKHNKQLFTDEAKQGSTFEAITKSQIESIQIPLPPLTEQHRIVEQITALQSQIDDLESQINTNTQAMQGVLTKYL